ncbi:MAG: hypothetical protein RLZZ156_97 [Deinococcota bacterium]
MKKDISHTVKLGLNSAGFKGKNLDSLTPDFMTDRKTELFLFWEPSYNGPHSWIIDVVVVGAIYKLGESFLNELFADLYNWSKKKLFSFFKKYPNNAGAIIINFKDVKIICYNYYVPEDKFFEFFDILPKLLQTIDKEKSKEWFAVFDSENQKWKLQPER